MKKIILVIAVMAFCMAATSFSVFSQDDTISIGLFYGDTAQATAQLMSGDGLVSGETELGTDVTAKNETNQVVILAPDGSQLLRGDENQQITITAKGAVMSVCGKKYRGKTVLVPENGLLKIISIANIDDYLCGVIPREVYASWPEETLKAQAICSRTLVYKSFRGKHKDLGFDVCATTNCQVYGGYESETEVTTAAVYETAGLVAVYDGKPADTLFCASNGGWREASSSVWSGSYPYLVTAKDEYEKTDEISGHVWTVELSADEVSQKVANAGYNVGAVKKLEIIEASQSGRVTALKVYGETGECEIKKASARSVFGLKSQLYTVTSPSSQVYAQSSQGTSPVEDCIVSGSSVITRLPGKVNVLSALGQTTVELGTSSDAKFVFSGRGYGHGVGMSQWGAKYMADGGFSCEEIVKYYYPGVEIVKY